MIKNLVNIYEKIYKHFQRQSVKRGHAKEYKQFNIPWCLTKDEERTAKMFWKKFGKVNLVYHNYYKYTYGVFLKEFIPDDIYLNSIDFFYNDVKNSKFIDNKCFYERIFNGIPQAKTFCMRINNFWFNQKNETINSYLAYETPVFVKAANNSLGGSGVFYCDNKDDYIKAISDISGDIIIQHPIKQHSALNQLNESSVNTYRIISLLDDTGVHILSSLVRIGVCGSKVDNSCSGGVCCGIDDTGKLKKYCYLRNGKKFVKHPTSNIQLEGFCVPCINEAKSLVMKCHIMVPSYRIVFWDIAVTEENIPILLEANLCRGGVFVGQMCNGPLFGENTKKYLEGVN